MTLKEQVFDIISKKYFFRDRFEKVKLLEKLEIGNSNSLNKVIRSFDDNHTFLFNNKYEVNNSICWLFGKPYLHINMDHSPRLKRIERIDNEKVDDIIEKYKKKYPNTSQNNLEKYFSQDFFLSTNEVMFGKEYNFDSRNENNQVTIDEIINGFYVSHFKSNIIIKIFHFNHKDLVLKLINLLDKIETKGIICLDIRNCSGGNILTAVKVSELFLSRNIELPYQIVSKEGSFKRIIEGKSKIERNRLVILIGKQTLSSAEFVLFQSLKVEGKCRSFGERTGGHSGQAHVIQLNNNNTLSYTVRRYIRDGKELSEGLDPDETFITRLDDILTQKDTLLERLNC